MPILNQAAAELPAHGIREISELASRRGDTIRLDIGDPDFATPAGITEAARTAALSGRTHYAPGAGVPELRAALARKVLARNGYHVDAEQVVVTQGASQGIFAALLALTQPGDHVLLPDPGWPNYLMMAQLLRVRPVSYPLSPAAGFVPSAEQLRALITPDVRVLLLNSPSNPTGAAIDRRRMRALVDLADEHDLWVISDECYDELVFDDSFVSAATLSPDRVISAYSFSKTYAMTGWRVGYLTVPAGIAGTVAKCQEALLACVSEPTQWAALEALTAVRDDVARMRAAYRHRRDLVLTALAHTAAVPFVPSGTFYAWVDITATGMSDRDFTLRLLAQHNVSVTPGSVFGPSGAGFVRLSLTAPDERVRDGVARLAAFVAEETERRSLPAR